MTYPELGEKSFQLPNGQYAQGFVPIDPTTGEAAAPGLTPDTLDASEMAAIMAGLEDKVLTDAQLRAAPVLTSDVDALAKLEELRLQLVTMLGNTDGVETLQQNAIDLLTLTNNYVDGVEALVTTLGENTDGLEGLLSTITGHVDALEPLLQDLKDLGIADATKQDSILLELGAIKAKLLLDKGQAAAASSLSVVLASDSDHATQAKQDALAVIAEAIRDKTLTEAQLIAALEGTPLAVTGTFWQATQPVSAVELPLPTNAATELTLEAVNTKTPALVSGASPVTLQVLGAAIPPHNNVLMSNFIGNNAQTVQYRLNTTVVATVTMTYDATGNMLSATRS
jgi:hypothetical protein